MKPSASNEQEFEYRDRHLTVGTHTANGGLFNATCSWVPSTVTHGSMTTAGVCQTREAAAYEALEYARQQIDKTPGEIAEGKELRRWQRLDYDIQGVVADARLVTVGKWQIEALVWLGPPGGTIRMVRSGPRFESDDDAKIAVDRLVLLNEGLDDESKWQSFTLHDRL